MNDTRGSLSVLSSLAASVEIPSDKPAPRALAASAVVATSDHEAGWEESGEGSACEIGPLFSARDESAGKAREPRNNPSPLVAALAQAVLDAHAKRAQSQLGTRGKVPTTLAHEPPRPSSPPLNRTGQRYHRGDVVVDVLEGMTSRP